MDVVEKEKPPELPIIEVGYVHPRIGEVLDFVERYPGKYYMFVKLPANDAGVHKYALHVSWNLTAPWGPDQPSLIYSEYQKAADLWVGYREMYRQVAFRRLTEIAAGDEIYDHESVERHKAVFIDF